jgi:hypothetical protein
LTDELDLHEDAVERYRNAQARVARALEAWRAAGHPLVTTHRNGMTGAATELKVLQDAERHADRMLKTLAAGRVGRPIGYQVAPDRQPPRRARLRRVIDDDTIAPAS